jgi:hypothetical protein
MSEITVGAGKFKRLLDYLDKIGLDPKVVAGRTGIAPEKIVQLPDDQPLPAQQYGRLYREAAREMQTLGHPIPWAAGLGSEAFELMCRCIITARTLGEALLLAERYEQLLYPVLGYNIGLLDDGESPTVKISYTVNAAQDRSVLAPANWDRADYQATVARASGLVVWCSFCGWLTGLPLEALGARVAAPVIGWSTLFIVQWRLTRKKIHWSLPAKHWSADWSRHRSHWLSFSIAVSTTL